MSDIINSFKRLPRPQTSPSGLPNHWVFRSRHVPLEPPGDLIVIVHPESRKVLQAGPFQLPSTMSVKEKAETMLPFLLQAFVKGSQDPAGRQIVEAWAPWSWSTDDAALSAAFEPLFKQHGLPDGLCTVGVCSAEEKAEIDECWHELVDHLMNMMGMAARVQGHSGGRPATSSVQLGDETKCHSCMKGRGDAESPLKKCAACGKAWYCSPQCQKAHWKQHKPACLANRPGNTASSRGSAGRPSSISGAFDYYNTVAHQVPEARTLAASLNLHLPSSASDRVGLAMPLRRLVLTGKDTPPNMALLFGSNWRDSLPESKHEETRLGVLLNPPPGSPSYVVSTYDNRDWGALGRSPRPASDAEQQKINEVREMQRLVRQRVGSGKSPTNADMKAILTGFGSNWMQKLPIYQLAVNTMDQGVQVR